MNDFILSLFSKEDKLKPTTLYLILIGKRTSSVLSYAYFHDLLHLSGAFPELAENEFYSSLSQLKQTGKLKETAGELRLSSEILPAKQFSFLNEVDFFRFGRRGMESWRLVQFLVQAVSFLESGAKYVPLESSPFYTEPVRQCIHQNRAHVKKQVFEELNFLFSRLQQEQADFLANTLSGNQHNGVAFFQLLPNIEQKIIAELTISAYLHHFYQELVRHPRLLLYQFLEPVLLQNINISMLQTKRMFEAGLSLEQIMHKRRLKQGTIQDHLIEWALLDDNFPFGQFLLQQEQLQKLPEESWKYPYKELVNQYEVSFLEIRLYQIWQRRQAC